MARALAASTIFKTVLREPMNQIDRFKDDFRA
jgi:hypothetical protein